MKGCRLLGGIWSVVAFSLGASIPTGVFARRRGQRVFDRPAGCRTTTQCLFVDSKFPRPFAKAHRSARKRVEASRFHLRSFTPIRISRRVQSSRVLSSQVLSVGPVSHVTIECLELYPVVAECASGLRVCLRAIRGSCGLAVVSSAGGPRLMAAIPALGRLSAAQVVGAVVADVATLAAARPQRHTGSAIAPGLFVSAEADDRQTAERLTEQVRPNRFRYFRVELLFFGHAGISRVLVGNPLGRQYSEHRQRVESQNTAGTATANGLPTLTRCSRAGWGCGAFYGRQNRIDAPTDRPRENRGTGFRS